MSDMTIERAVEVLNREKHANEAYWSLYVWDGLKRVHGNMVDYRAQDAIIIAKWYESQQPPDHHNHHAGDDDKCVKRGVDMKGLRVDADSVDMDAIEGRVNAATPGPWYTKASMLYAAVLLDTRLVGVEWADFVFIGHARDDIPALAREVRRLAGELHLRAEDFGAATKRTQLEWERAERLKEQLAALTAERDALQERLRAAYAKHRVKAVACNFSGCGCDFCEALDAQPTADLVKEKE